MSLFVALVTTPYCPAGPLGAWWERWKPGMLKLALDVLRCSGLESKMMRFETFILLKNVIGRLWVLKSQTTPLFLLPVSVLEVSSSADYIRALQLPLSKE
ncbi:hypothetical protein Tco_0775582 [Tanacetum coccineum]